MQFEQLDIENLGVYRGSHTINLAPRSNDRPIVLIGALNGSGKTTIIEALQLALYGRRAEYGWRGASTYTQYLGHVRNRFAPITEPTRIELVLRLVDGRRLRVRRQWSFHGATPREYLDVFANDATEADPELSRSWDEEIERLLPSKLSELFFFDGERIEQLANPKSSAVVLRAAISSLLGIDLIDGLVSDLSVVRQRQARSFVTEADRSDMAAVEAQEEQLAEAISACRQECAALTNSLDKAQTRVRAADIALQAQGQDRYQRQGELLELRVSAASAIESGERELRDIAAGSLPLLLASNLLSQIHEAAEARASQFRPGEADFLRRYTERLRSVLPKAVLSPRLSQELEKFLEQELSSLARSGNAEESIDPRIVSEAATRLLGSTLPQQLGKVRSILDALAKSRRGLDKAEQKLAGLPAPEQLTAAIDERAAAESAMVTLRSRIGETEHRLRQLTTDSERLEARKLKLLERTLEAGDATRVAGYCDRAQTTLAAFRSNLVRQRRQVLEQLVFESFTLLARKDDLAAGVTIDPVSMELRLHAPDGNEIRPEQLSAGERQLLAVAMLWGLAKASGRRIPIVIDTPLGRLDGDHRGNLVRRYFPEASHQVVLLSTDEELGTDWSAVLDESISRRYLVEYDPAIRSSRVTEGYFQQVTS